MARLLVSQDYTTHTLTCDDCPKLRQVSQNDELINANARTHVVKFPGHTANITISTTVRLTIPTAE
jgi:hypothetical protein